jgi:two-component system response regulator HydG
MADEIIDVAQLPEYIKIPVPNVKEEEYKTLKEMEKNYILKVLQSVDNNKSKAAEILGIDRKTLRMKIS